MATDTRRIFAPFASQSSRRASSQAGRSRVTPSRRPHSQTESDTEQGDESDVSLEEPGSVHSHGSKRIRLDRDALEPNGYDESQLLAISSQDVEDDEDDDDIDEAEAVDRRSRRQTTTNLYSASRSPERPLLPDSYLRSPQKSARISGVDKHQPGAIVRVKLRDFVTYTEAEFKPGPHLNMIIGPNGTGKSTLVCAICLGLGWKTQHLGRAKDIGDFVKHGERTAHIEIELAADPARHDTNPIITTKITREANKVEYAIDGRKVSSRALLELMKSFSIQVDNLCQFLPQDRVVEFAALSPVDLLAQTQKAAAPEQMTVWHEELKSLRREQRARENKKDELDSDVKNLQNRQRLQEADVARVRERATLQSRLHALEKLKPFPEYTLAKAKHAECKERRKESEREFKRLTRKMEPNLQAVEAKKEYQAQIQKAKTARAKLVERTHVHIESIQANHTELEDKIRLAAKELETDKEQIKQDMQEKLRQKGNIQTIERAMQNPPMAFDTTVANAKIGEKNRQLREIEDRAFALTEAMNSLMEQVRQRNTILKEGAAQRERLQTQAGQQEQKLRLANSQVAQAWQWMQANRDKFKGEFFGPPLIECSVTDERHAPAVEAAIGMSELLALTTTHQDDFNMLLEQIYTHMKLDNVNVRFSTAVRDQFRAPMNSEEMQSVGLEAFLIDLIDGPDQVLAMLCDNRNLHAHGFSNRSISHAQHEALLRTNLGAWSTPKERNTVARRREYGDQGQSVRSAELRPARFFIDGAVEPHEDADSRRKEAEIKDELGILREEMAEKKSSLDALRIESKSLEEEREVLQKEKNARQAELSQFNGLSVKLDQATKKLEACEKRIEAAHDRRVEVTDQTDRLVLSKGQTAIDLANATDQLKTLHMDLFEAEIAEIEAGSDLAQLEQRHVQEIQLLRQSEDEMKRLTTEAQLLLEAGRELQAVCQDVGNSLTDQEQLIFEEIRTWTPDQLETEIQSAQARIEMTGGNGNQHILREYEERAQLLAKREEQLEKVSERLEMLEQQIGTIREQWEPGLDRLIEQISTAFADNFAKIQCAGEVAVYKDEDFEKWAIQIKVKFRETEQLSILDSHRQSGGERAVSTIFYLMALQSLARAPFRVVDEINQGMDPRNERLVHSRMVDIACAENSASQYFLITPKLLNDLKYHPSMKVHCIASGEYMPDDHRELDFGRLAQKALAVRRAQTAAH